MKNTSLFYIVFQVLTGYFCEKLQDTATSSFIFCFTSVFISADTFYNFLELHSTSEKDFITNFPFLTDSPKPPTPLMTKIFKA